DITAFLKENPHAYDYYFETCDLFMPVCDAFTKYLINAGCDPEKIIVSHSSIDCSRFTFKQKDFPEGNDALTIVGAGRFVEKKGFVYSIRAVAKLIKKFPQIRYRIIGNGILKKDLQKLIEKLDMKDKITLENWYPHNEYIPILHNSDIFILTSVTAQNNDQEGIPNVLIEAMATGLVTVATDHSGNSELITHGKTGFLVPERNSKAIYNTLKYILKNKHTLPSMQQAASQKVHEEFENEKENDTLEMILYNLVNKEKMIN
ncbi:MAG TPA: glycosyltransferase, partial [Candidatus Babeliales bacterium]|nr:glycosyltransferase [Candidatus Babeliales bacterium]